MRLSWPCVLSQAAAVAEKGTKRGLICDADGFRASGH